ncbi:MAG: T9SS type A sorting domain-containing protein [Flavobacterium sp.]|nr:MAG: T9SS type A sorting domain-containing protein [Flavobacterium sp.]
MIDNFKLSPNPVIDNLNIESDNQIINIIIYNQLGQIIFSNEINDNKRTLDLSNLSSGIYTIFIETNARTLNKKIIKQ